MDISLNYIEFLVYLLKGLLVSVFQSRFIMKSGCVPSLSTHQDHLEGL